MQVIPTEIQLSKLGEPPEFRWNAAVQTVATQIQLSELAKPPQFRWNGTRQCVSVKHQSSDILPAAGHSIPGAGPS